jgi:SAM-dependent methyltransferase
MPTNQDTDTAAAPPSFQLTAEAAEAYEAFFVPAFFAQWAPRLLDAAGVGAGQRVLDVACGTGIVARGASARVAGTGSVVGLDLNEAMLAVARRISPEVDWRAGAAAALPFADGEFDVTLSQMAMMFFPDPGAALREMARVTRRGGTVGVLLPGPLAASPPYVAFVDIVSRHAGPEARALVTTYFSLGDPDRLTSLFTAAGLLVTATCRQVGSARYDSIEHFVTIEIDGTPLAQSLDPAVRAGILAECGEALAPYQVPGGPALIPIECTTVVATRP